MPDDFTCSILGFLAVSVRSINGGGATGMNYEVKTVFVKIKYNLLMTQKEALDILKMGHNAYITGPAGSGKTHLINMYLDYLDEHDVDVGITASTGIAATHIGGVTIHSWTGLGVRNVMTEYDLENLQEKQYLFKRMEKARVLIIDEVSMLHHFRLDLVDKVLKAFKRNDEPFGGLQVILCGDFFQLPPVSRYGEPDALFVYHSDAWKKGDFKICYLEENYRQKDDAAVRVLNDIRASKVDQGTMAHLKKCFKHEKNAVGPKIEPTRLYTHNIDVDKVNEQALRTLASDEAEYQMETTGNEILVDILKKSCLAPEFLRLKVGAKVMFVKNNFDAGYVNGTLGIVKKLHGPSGGPTVETYSGDIIDVLLESWTIEEDGKVKAELNQYPLRLAWAITVHKSQGMSLDAVEVDLSKSFEKGMGYVALSRVRSLEGLTILGLNDNALEVHPEVLLHDDTLRRQSQQALRELYEVVDRGDLKAAQDAFIRSIAPAWVFEEKIIDGKKVRVKGKKPPKQTTFEKTLIFVKEGLTLKEIAEHRAITEATVISHIEKLIEDKLLTVKEVEYIKKSLSRKKFDDIADALAASYKKTKEWHLSPVKNALGGNISYKDIQLVRLFIKE